MVPPRRAEPGPGRRPASAEEHRALAHPLRLQILRLCLHEQRTNKELADELGKDPGTVLHHVRMLVDAGLLVAGTPRRGARGSREKPYLATRLSWELDSSRTIGEGGSVEVAIAEAHVAELRAAMDTGEPDVVVTSTRMGLRLTAEDQAELRARLDEVRDAFAARDDPGGEPISVYLHAHRRP